jgi:amino acid adenylation domain-containing protein
MSAKNIEDAYPLSPMQEGMLFHSLLAPESGIYITQVSCRLRDLDASIFAQVWQQLIDRQAVLRTAFVWKNLEKPLQVVGRHVGLPLEQQDWRELPSSAQAERFEAYLEADRKAGFNLMKAPVMRLALFQTSERDYEFLWSNHHILLDGWSVSLLLSDFRNLYKAVLRNENHCAERRRRYRDYIGWLQQQDLGQAEAFWRRTLKGFAEPTRLGLELKSINAELQPPQSQNYEEQHLNLSESTTAGLQKLGREQQVTLNTVMQGAWALLLSRYSGSEDVVFGATVSGRPASLAGVEEMVGLFINTLPVRVQVKSEEGVSKYLRRFQEQQVEARQYEYSPLVEVQGWSDVGRGVRLFESIFVFENYPVTEILKESNWALKIGEVRSIEPSNYPLALIVLPRTPLGLNLVYDRERYDPASMARMLDHLETLFEAIALNPEQPLTALSLLRPAERDQILVAWNQTRRAYDQDCCLHGLFEAQVARTPNAPAITFADRHLTYRQLDDRANQLARHLQHLGVGPEVLVGVLLERSLEMVIALYAILKAGGAYVPLEPSYPRERLAFMLDDLRVPVVLTQAGLAGLLPEHHAQVVALDSDWSAFAGEPVHNLGVTLTPLNAAYVIYTSGSSGQPKAVMNTHGGICNRLLWMQEAYQLKAGDVVLQKTPFSFDVSVWEFFWPLLAGARLVVAKPEGHRDSAYLINLIKREQVTTLHFVPSMLQVFLENEGARECASLQRVICSGEALTREVQERYYERMPGELHNLYGPTEAAVDVTYWACERESLRRAVPIGRPIANTQIYILDQRLEAVPVAIAGELFIGGVNLARGYLKRAESTAEKFIPHPYSRRKGERLYQTGDRVRWLADGNIEYLGRIDQQVKIRGFRIEPEEVRVALMQHPDVKDAVISTHGDSIEDRRLVAYIIAAAERELSSSDLSDYLKERLPEYLVPSVFVTLKKVPLTANGKIDYRALPQPNGLNVGLKNEYVAPRTDAEQLLRDIWQEVISIERIGIHDNFFDLGGHSILLLKAQQKIRERFQHELSLVELFKYPTIQLLAERLKREPDAALAPPSFQRSFARAETRRELVSRQRETRKRNVAGTSS